jgi:hypothetical protein
MRNAVAVVALLISVGGIFVSIAREEMRCYLGLANECGLPEKATPPNSTQKEEARENQKEETVYSPTRVETSTRKPEPIFEPEAVSETKESSEKLIEKETAQKSFIEPFKSQPIEVIPPPEVQSESQPIEVIPPPEDPQ